MFKLLGEDYVRIHFPHHKYNPKLLEQSTPGFYIDSLFLFTIVMPRKTSFLRRWMKGIIRTTTMGATIKVLTRKFLMRKVLKLLSIKNRA